MDCLHVDGTLSTTFGQETNALVGCYLNLPPRMRKGVTAVLDDQRSGANWTPSLGGEYFSIRAMFAMGYPDMALARLRREWTPQVLDGAETFWEGKSPFSRSRCHTWAAGANIFYITHILGIQPLEPGYRAVEIAPLVEKLNFASGQVWTPRGNLEVAWEFSGKKQWGLTVTAPEDVRVNVNVPKQKRLVGVKQAVRIHTNPRAAK